MLFTVVLGAVGVLSSAPVLAQAGTLGKPRTEVETVPGRYIQLDTLWVPVHAGRKRPSYMGLVVRLYPAADARYDACIAAPAVGEHIVIRLNQHPLQLALWEDTAKLQKLVAALVGEVVEPALYTQVQVVPRMEVPEKDSTLLTLTCR